MRKVKFPFNLDVTPFLSDDLKGKLSKTHAKVIAIEKERDERVKIRRKAKAKREEAMKSDANRSADPKSLASASTGGVEAPAPADAMAVDTTEEPMANAAPSSSSAPGQVLTEEEEVKLRAQEADEVRATVHPDLLNDHGCNTSALYELVGIVTHKGAAADAGHYISWVRKEQESDVEGVQRILDAPAEQEWYKVRPPREVVLVPAD
jgi:ubiquitin carboxyl-terminal hydrolase 14